MKKEDRFLGKKKKNKYINQVGCLPLAGYKSSPGPSVPSLLTHQTEGPIPLSLPPLPPTHGPHDSWGTKWENMSCLKTKQPDITVAPPSLSSNPKVNVLISSFWGLASQTRARSMFEASGTEVDQLDVIGLLFVKNNDMI